MLSPAKPNKKHTIAKVASTPDSFADKRMGFGAGLGVNMSIKNLTKDVMVPTLMTKKIKAKAIPA